MQAPHTRGSSALVARCGAVAGGCSASRWPRPPTERTYRRRLAIGILKLQLMAEHFSDNAVYHLITTAVRADGSLDRAAAVAHLRERSGAVRCTCGRPGARAAGQENGRPARRWDGRSGVGVTGQERKRPARRWDGRSGGGNLSQSGVGGPTGAAGGRRRRGRRQPVSNAARVSTLCGDGRRGWSGPAGAGDRRRQPPARYRGRGREPTAMNTRYKSIARGHR